MAINLETGAVRFMVGFEDADLRIPIIRTIKFLHLQQSDRGERLIIFQEIHSTTSREQIFVREFDFDELVLDKERLLEILHRCFEGDLASRRSSSP